MLKKFKFLIISFLIPLITSLIALIFSGYIMSNFFSRLLMPLLLGVAGLGMYKYIKDFIAKDEDLISLGISVCYCLSGYMTSYGFNILYLFAAAIFPYIIYALTLYITKDKPYPYIILIFLTSLVNSWLAIMISLFTGIYMMIISPETKSIKKKLLKILTDISLILVFVPVHFNLFIPLKSELQNTNERLNRFLNLHFPASRISGSFFDVLKSLLSGTHPSSTFTYGYGIDICCGAFILFLAIAFLLNRKISLRLRISHILLILLLLIACIYDTANYFFNGFHYSDDNQTYFGFMVSFTLLVISAKEIKEIEGNHPATLIISYISSYALLTLSALYSTHYDTFKPFIYTAELLIFYGVTVLLLKSKYLTKKIFTLLFSLLMIGESIYFSFSNIKCFVDYSKNDIASYVAQVIKSKTSDKDYKVLILLNDEISVEPFFNMIYGYDYIAEPPLEMTKNNKGTALPSAELSDMDLINPQDERVSIYKNPYSLHGFYISKNTADIKYYKNCYFDYINDVADSNIYSVLLDDTNFSFVPQVAVDEKNHINPNHDRIAALFLPDTGATYYNHLNSTHYLGYKDKEETSFITEEISIRRSLEQHLLAQYASFNLDNFISCYDSLKNTYNPYSFVKKAAYSSNSDDATSAGADVLYYYVSDIPYSYGISINVNGENRKGLSVLNGLLAVPVYERDFTNGTPSYKVSYINRYPLFGLMILIAGILFFIAIKLYYNEKKGKTYNWIKDNYVYISVVLIPSLVLLLVMLIRTCSPFGNNSLYIGDGFYQGLSGYIDNMRSIKNGSFSVLRYNMALISDNTLSVYNMWLSPVHYLTAKLLPESLYELTFTLSRILPFIFGGLSLCFYLTHRRNRKNMSKHDPRLIVLSLSFVLSSYSICYFVYSGFGFLTYIPLMVLALERLIYDKKKSFYIILLYMFIGDPYYGFMMCVFLFLYFFTMDFKNFKDFFFKGLRFGLSSIAAAGLHAYSLLPYYLGTFDHSYKVNDTVPPSFTKWTANLTNVLSDYHSFHRAVISTSDTSRVQIYAGLLTLLLFGLYFFISKIPIRERIGHGLIMLLYFLSFMNEGLNYCLHGFHYQSLVPNRFSIFFIFLMIKSVYDVIINWKEITGKKKIIIPAVTLIFISVSWIMSDKIIGKFCTGVSIAVGLIYLLIIIYSSFNIKMHKSNPINDGKITEDVKKHKNNDDKKIQLVFYIMAFELILSSLYTFYGAAGMDMTERHFEELNALIDRHDETKEEFYNTEIQDTNLVNAQNFFGVNSISGFSSGFTMTNMAMLDRYNIHTSSNIIGYVNGNPLADMFLRVKYVITDTNSTVFDSPYPVIDKEGQFSMHYNDHALSLGIFMGNDEALTKYDSIFYNSDSGELLSAKSVYDNAFDMQNEFAKCFGSKDLYSEIEVREINVTDNDDNNDYMDNSIHNDNNADKNNDTLEPVNDDYFDSDYYQINPDENDRSYMIVHVHIQSLLKGKLYIALKNGINYIGELSDDPADFYIRLPNVKAKNISFGLLNESVYEDIYNDVSKYQMYDITTTSSTISGKIDAPKDGTVFISLPHLYGFKALVDGKEVEIIDFMGGMGIEVTAGNHTLALSYKRANMLPGYIITLITIISLAMISYFQRKYTHVQSSNCLIG